MSIGLSGQTHNSYLPPVGPVIAGSERKLTMKNSASTAAPRARHCSVSVDDGDNQWRKEYRRLQAIAKQHRRGNKKHAGVMAFETSKGRLSTLLRRYQSRLEAIERLQRMSDSPMAKLTQELAPPDGYDTVAVFDCEEVSFYYENEDTGDMIELPWLFDQDHVWPDDCEAVGIRVE